MTLDQLEIGQSAEILHINGKSELRHHLLNMGLTPGTNMTLRKAAPMGDPIQMGLRGYELTICLFDARKIEIQKVQEPKQIRTDKS